MKKGKLNNKGFAVTTILFGILVLFLLLLLSLLGILSMYKGNVEKLIDANNGGRQVATMEKITKCGDKKCENITKNQFLNMVESNEIKDARSGLYCFRDVEDASRKECLYISMADLTFEESGLEYSDTFGVGDYYDSLVIKNSGYYFIEAYGAAGGNAKYNGFEVAGGGGAYTSGYIYLNAGETLYFFVGRHGNTTTYGNTGAVAGGYNGGGYGKGNNGKIISSGGGASDIRIGGNFDDLDNIAINSGSCVEKNNTRTCELSSSSIDEKTTAKYVVSDTNKAKIGVKYTVTVEGKAAGIYQLIVDGKLLSSNNGTCKVHVDNLDYGSYTNPKYVLVKNNNKFTIEVNCSGVVKANYDETIQKINRIIYSRLEDRIMVAGGGGGAVYSSNTDYGVGGGGGSLKGGSGTLYQGGKVKGEQIGGLQTSPVQISSGKLNQNSGGFGYGGNGTSDGMAGGGGGYNGGKGSKYGGSGGSSYISGYAGVNSVNGTASEYTNDIKHKSGKYFVNGVINAGENRITANNSGDGSISIDYVGDSLPAKTNKYLNNVRYVRDCINGSTENNDNHWVEIQAIAGGVVVSNGKLVTGINPVTGATVDPNKSRKYELIVNGVINNDKEKINSSQYAQSSSQGLVCVTIDLGNKYDLDEIAVWHYYTDGRIYKNKVTSVSSDGNTWIPVIDEDNNAAETYDGFRVSAWDNPFTYAIKYTGKFITKTEGTEKTYVNSYARFSRNDWSLKLISGGVLTAVNRGISTDIFLVGGGGGGSTTDKSGGGGGGYVKTASGILIESGKTYNVEIGAGGAVDQAGGTTKIWDIPNYPERTLAAAGGNPAVKTTGGAGGSGGGGGGDKKVYAGGTNGENGTVGSSSSNTGGIGCKSIADADNKWHCFNTYAFGDIEFDGITYANGGQGGTVGAAPADNTGNGGNGRNIKGASGVIIIRSSFISANVNKYNEIEISISSFTNNIEHYCIQNVNGPACPENKDEWNKVGENKAWFKTGRMNYGDYIVNIADNIGNVYKSTIVSVTKPFSEESYDFSSPFSENGCDEDSNGINKHYLIMKDSGTLEIKEDVKVDIFMVGAGANGGVAINTTETVGRVNVYGANGGGGGNTATFTTVLNKGTYTIKIGTNISNVSGVNPDPSTSIYYNGDILINKVSGYKSNGGTRGIGAIIYADSCKKKKTGCTDITDMEDVSFDTAKMTGGNGVKAFGGDTQLPTLYGAGGGGSASIANSEERRKTSLNGGATGGGASGYYYVAEAATGDENGESNNTEELANIAKNGKDGLANTGSGGGAAYGDGIGGKGGSGVIIIRAYNMFNDDNDESNSCKSREE